MAARTRNRRLLRWGSLATAGAYLLAILELAFMSTPFAAYYYGVYSPLLGLLHRSPSLSWLSAFFVTHLSVPDSRFFTAFGTFGDVLTFLGAALFVAHAIYLYWTKFVKKAVATRLLYAYVRHPQYACLIATGLGLAIMWPRFINLFLLVAMTAVYFALARHEERRMEAKHGAAYRDYADGRAIFFPGNPGRWVLGRVLARLPLGKVRWGLAAVAMLALAPGGSFALRAYSVASLHSSMHPELPGTLVVALDPPETTVVKRLALEAARSTGVPTANTGSATLLILVWDRDRLRHLLADAGIRHGVLEAIEIPKAAVYVVEASIRIPSASEDAGGAVDPKEALSVSVVRRLETIHYQVREANGVGWREFHLPDDAVQAHASLPIV